ncbi:uncharacterized protein [Montipora capricornis]|uniref:uncharacterized protein n=1 Tax=Montipora capricornis TaxID=246305 RepID=UPI0035F13BA4
MIDYNILRNKVNRTRKNCRAKFYEAKLRTLNPNKASGPDQIPSWLLKDNADILAAPVADFLNSSFQESRLPKSWKRADITPPLKQSLVLDFNKHLQPISLTPKVAEDYVVEEYIEPAVLVKVDCNQFGTVPNSSTAHALISMLHTWYQKTDGNSSTFRVVLFDFKKTFDLIDHRILLEKLKNFDMPEWVRLWIKDFLGTKESSSLKTASQSGVESLPAYHKGLSLVPGSLW